MSLKKSFANTFGGVALAVAAAVSFACVTSIIAPQASAAAKQGLSAKVGAPMQAAKDLLTQKKYKEALDKVNEAAAITGKNAYEEQIISQYKMVLLMALGDTPAYVKQVETMLAANQIPADQMQEILKNLQSSYFRMKDYSKSIQYGERYLKEVGQNSDVAEFIARSYYLKGDYKTAIEKTQQLIRQAEQSKRVPDKAFYEIIMSSYYKQDNKSGVADTLELLIANYPSAQYWKDIFNYIGNENGGSYSDKEKIEIFRLKKAVGALDADEYVEFGELCLAMTDPGDAKAILEAGTASGAIKATERNTKLLNRAKADAAADLATLDAADKESEKKPTGEASAKMGFAYLGHGKFDKAATSLQRGITKGGLGDNLDLTYVQLGVANFSLGKKAEATKAFQSVSSKGKLARVAKLWVIYSQKH